MSRVEGNILWNPFTGDELSLSHNRYLIQATLNLVKLNRLLVALKEWFKTRRTYFIQLPLRLWKFKIVVKDVGLLENSTCLTPRAEQNRKKKLSSSLFQNTPSWPLFSMTYCFIYKLNREILSAWKGDNFPRKKRVRSNVLHGASFLVQILAKTSNQLHRKLRCSDKHSQTIWKTIPLKSTFT